jgi:ribosome-binding ATPase YchF (GTP1/OBG family)
MWADLPTLVAPQPAVALAVSSLLTQPTNALQFCTIEPNVGMVTVPDPRLQQLSTISKSKDTVRSAEGARSVSQAAAATAAAATIAQRMQYMQQNTYAVQLLLLCFTY